MWCGRSDSVPGPVRATHPWASVVRGRRRYQGVAGSKLSARAMAHMRS